MTTAAEVRLMLHRCGLSQTDAAAFLFVQDRTVRRWVEGSRAPAPEQWQALADLCAQQDLEAGRALAQIAALRKVHGRPREVTLRLARTPDEALRLGWPCPGAHMAVLRRVIEWAPKGLRIIPVHPGEDAAADTAAERRSAH